MKGDSPNITGMRFGSVVALGFVEVRGTSRFWEFLCDCGNVFVMANSYARTGRRTSCPSCGQKRTGIAATKHGKSRTKLYTTWIGMRNRCTVPGSPAYEKYGGRGIKVCDRWMNSFENFALDMGDKPSKHHSIDRIDVNGNYEPGNCRWATYKEQQLNRRNTVYIDVDGKKMTLYDLEAMCGISSKILGLRLVLHKWDLKRAMTQPPRTRKAIKHQQGTIND